MTDRGEKTRNVNVDLNVNMLTMFSGMRHPDVYNGISPVIRGRVSNVSSSLISNKIWQKMNT